MKPFKNIIDLPLWDKSRWLGVGWFWPPGTPPGMGILFKNTREGSRIFADWKKRFGERDEEEAIRISIIEGAIPDADPGYTVRIGMNLDVAFRQCEAGKMRVVASRIHRMNPPQKSANLAIFKRAYAQYGCFAIVQAVRDSGPMGIMPIFETAIMKKEIHFRQVEEILSGDQDADALIAPPG